jgi:hypothetical protein
MKVFHGSNVKIETIDLNKCEDYKDFGSGFYVTNIEAHATTWANKMQEQRHEGAPVVTAFEFWDEAFHSNLYRALRFAEPSREWVEFVMLNRRNKNAHDWDIVEGPVANDWVNSRIARCLRGQLTIDELVRELTYREPTHQICFCTTLSLDALTTLDDNARWKKEDITNAILEALLAQGMEQQQAQEHLFTSKTYTSLADTATGLYLKSWQEICEMLTAEHQHNS